MPKVEKTKREVLLLFSKKITQGGNDTIILSMIGCRAHYVLSPRAERCGVWKVTTLLR